MWPVARRYHDLFWRVGVFRPKAFEGYNRIPPGTIRDWAESLRVPLTPLDYEMIYEMDEAFIITHMKADEGTRDLTTKDFDQKFKGPEE